MRLRETDAALSPGAKSAGHAFAAHEYHHVSLENLSDGLIYAYEVERGHGINGRRDGLVPGNLLAGFSHQRDTAGNRWAKRFVGFVRARGFRHGVRVIEAAAAAG